MRERIEQREGEKLHKVLFACVLVMLAPVVIQALLELDGIATTKNSAFMVLMSGAFLVQTVVFVVGVTKFKVHVGIFPVLFLGCGILTLVVDILIGIKVDYFDFFNLIARIMCIIFFYDTVQGKTISDVQLRKYAKCLMILSVIACLYNIIVYRVDIRNIFALQSSAYAVNMKSFFINRNQFAMFLVVAYIYSDYVYIGERNRWVIVVHALQLFCMVCTLSRGSLLAIGAYYGARHLIYTKNKRRILNWVLFSLMIFAGVTALVAMPQLWAFLAEKLLRVGTGTTGRGDIWKMGLEIASNNPITGVGLYSGIDIAKESGFRYEQFHSLFIDSVVNGGIVELFLIICLVGDVYRKCIRHLWGTKFRAVYQASVVSVLCLSIFESVSFFSIGYVDTFFTINYITIPLLMSRMKMAGDEEMDENGQENRRDELRERM